jgi:hypothetical protein
MDVTQNRGFSGRVFTEEEMALIREITATYPKLSLAELANTICELVDWTQTDGKPKTVQCMRFLRGLAEEGALVLPAINERISTARGEAANKETPNDLSWIDMSELNECGSVKLVVIRPGMDLRQWRAYMSNYHRLGDPNVFGSQIRYMIRTEYGRDLGCMLFSASSWSLKPREEWIGWGMSERKARLHLVVNQSRFLIFPWIRVRNLASRALSIAARRIQRDWLDIYCYAPVLLETFVDPSLYYGTCYKAANWVYIGETQGRGRCDQYRKRILTRKAIYMYPLQRDFRAVLMGEKPWKALPPHI